MNIGDAMRVESNTDSQPEIKETVAVTQPSGEINKMAEDKQPGIYLVNVEIASGVWRSKPGNDSCFWKTTTRTGKTIKNYFGKSGGTMYIDPKAFEVTMKDECGIWTYLGE